MISPETTSILIIGLGLMGGSYAQALTDCGYEVGAIDCRPESIDYARKKGWIRHGSVTVDESYVNHFSLLIFALYPHTLLDWLGKYQHCIRPGALLTDVTGVKGSIVHTVQELLRDDLEFIGAHPMAGRELSGVEHANREIFRGANYIVTPTEKNTPAAIEACAALGRTLGFERISTLTPERHDEMIAFLSQLTHCIAVSLMACKDAENLSAYTGDSFRDLTRIAKINDAMWSELFLLNKSALLAQMDLFSETFSRLRNCIEQEDVAQMRALMQLSTQRRAIFDRRDVPQ